MNKMPSAPSETPPAALDAPGPDAAHGIDAAEAAKRLEEFGPNEIATAGDRGPWLTLLAQFRSVMTLVLGVAAGAAALTGDLQDATAIVMMLLLNALLGFRQEYKAERAMAELARLAAPTVRVRRAGIVQVIPARELVPGDVVLIEGGNLIPADARLIESWNLRTNEAALTGESQPVDKDVDSEVYLGTIAVHGRATAVVTQTGPATALGRIAGLLKNVRRPPTQLEVTLERAARKLAWIAVWLVAVIFAVGYVNGEPLRQLFLTAISLAVAAVPEGLPTVLVVALAISSQRMLKRNALIRKLSAIEALGAVTVICTDKTGTLTENRMQVVWAFTGARMIPLAGVDRPASDSALDALLLCGLLANDAEAGESGTWIGDPTEVALAEAALSRGLDPQVVRRRFPRISELPFDSGRKRMSTMHRVAGQDPPLFLERAPYFSVTKGALEAVLGKVDAVWASDRDQPLTTEWRERILEAHEKMAGEGMRVLAIAFRRLHGQVRDEDLETGLVFAGLTGLLDPPRPETKAAIETCYRAGIRPVMITGDHPLTAGSIARELGIAGGVIHAASTSDLKSAVLHTGVYARATPENKLELVRALQETGQTVAMTGDGINDALALKAADVGIAMGRQGTDVARESADIVLRDDNFATIVAAVEEGRVIDDNIRRFVRFILACNSGELWVMLLASLAGMPLALLPLQILWMNLVTDGLPALALGMEPAERGVMHRPPRSRQDSLFGRAIFVPILWIGLLIGLVSFLGGLSLWRQANPAWQTVVFTVTTLSQLGLALASRSDRESLFSRGMRSNPLLLGAVAVTFALQVCLIYLPVFQGIFGTRALSAFELAWSILLSTGVFWAVELEKSLSAVVRRRAGQFTQ